MKWSLLLPLVVACGSSSPSSAPKPLPSPSPDTAGGRVHPFTIGTFEAYAVFDGTIDGPNDAKIFGVGHPPEEISGVLAGAHQPTDNVHLDITPLLVKANGKVLLFDAGAAGASFAKAGNLRASLLAAQVKREDVTDIFISHGHADHVLGLVVSGAAAFPSASIHLSTLEWAAVQKEAETDADAKLVASVIAPKVVPFEPGALVMPGVKAVDTRGHTAGHSSYEIGDGADKLLYLGDVAHHFVISVQRPGWDTQFDADHAAADAMRQKTLENLAASHTRVFAVHFPFPGLGRIERQGDHLAWVPESGR